MPCYIPHVPEKGYRRNQNLHRNRLQPHHRNRRTRTLSSGTIYGGDRPKRKNPSILREPSRRPYLDTNQHRLSDSWPWHRDNLLKLLELCSDEIDEALICLVGWSVGMATLQARYLLERDLI
jgi:hypothetical protein